jgi:hypothetical protein
MQKMLSISIAQERPRLDANPPPPPKVSRVGSSAASKRSAAYKSSASSNKMTDGNESSDEQDLFESDPEMEETSKTDEKPSARKKRQSTKRCNDVRNWQAGKVRNCTPERINDDIEEATVRNLQEVVGKMQKLGYAVLMDYKEATDDPVGTEPQERGSPQDVQHFYTGK